MIGSRATSGSVAMRFRNVVIASLGVEQVGVHVHVEEVRAAAHLLERDLDRARRSRPPRSARRKRAEPVTFVRSPIITKPGVGPDLERLEAAEARRAAWRFGTRLAGQSLTRVRDRPDVLGRRAAAAADDVHEAGLGELARGSGSCRSGCSS